MNLISIDSARYEECFEDDEIRLRPLSADRHIENRSNSSDRYELGIDRLGTLCGKF